MDISSKLCHRRLIQISDWKWYAVNAPVSVMETAGEGGPYGMALLVSYMIQKEDGESLPDFLDNKVFAG